MNKRLFSFLLYMSLATLPVVGQTQLVFGPGPEGAGSALDAIAAVVNDDVITRRELEAATALIKIQLQRQKVPVPPDPVLESQVLERLILAQLQLRAAERNGITVDDATLNTAIETLARRNNMNLTQLRQTVEKEGNDFAKFRDDVRREIMAARLRQKLVDSQINVSEQDVDSLQAQLAGGGGLGDGNSTAGGEREYHLAQILIALPENATPQQVETARREADQVLARLRQGADFRQVAVSVSAGRQALEGGDLGWRRADQLPTLFAEVVPKLRPGQLSELIRSPSGFHIVKLLEVKGGSGEAPSSAPSNPVTQTRARHILLKTSPQLSDDQARQRLTQLRQRIRNGEDFADVARANSEDTASGGRGGDLGWVAPGMLVPRFEQAMNELQPDEISAPFKTQFGWHIVQVQERRQGPASTETERARVREALLRRRADEEWEQTLRRLREEAYVEIRLQPAAASVENPTPSVQ
ncbi:MAG: peptidylprolyl isomerase [Candidatus Competibacter sp.]|nr:peptidylprolyl isomerase [Candidatus Competibacter sp.]MDG4583918.1 peptidylprolyl isomerase [Candidatus Competibacter sp.]